MSYSFPNSLDVVEFADHDNYDSTSDLTISAWVNVPAWAQAVGHHPFIAYKDVNYALFADDDVGGLEFHWWNGTERHRLRTSGQVFPPSGISHIVGQASANDVYKLWIDGVDVSGATVNLGAQARDLTAVFQLGGTSGANGHLDGTLGEFGLWDVVLIVDEVIALSKGFSPLLIRPTSLKAYIPLVLDATDLVTGRVGTVTGATVADHPRVLMPAPRPAPFVPLVPQINTGRLATVRSLPMRPAAFRPGRSR